MRHFLIALLLSSGMLEAAQIEEFTRQGDVRDVREVHVRFSEPMIAFGDSSAKVAPFAIDCSAKGGERWADPQNWVYSFDQDLPSGVRCAFTLKNDTKTLEQKPFIGAQRYEFS